ncbi:MAG: Crp/Fnr family transcriptional regulator [Pseudomonadota bacterium]
MRRGGKLITVILTELIGGPPVTDGLVAGLSEAEAALLFQKGRPLKLARGDHVFRQGEQHTGIFIIRTGSVRVYYSAPSGREITLAHWAPPNFVGGPELFGNGVHDWSGVALEPTEVVLIPGADLRALVLTTPKLGVNLIEGLVGKARCYSWVLQMLGTRSVLERLAYLLLTLSVPHADGRRIERRLSHADIASVVGASRQWVSSALERFRTQNLVTVDDAGRFVIVNARSLKELAQM